MVLDFIRTRDRSDWKCWNVSFKSIAEAEEKAEADKEEAEEEEDYGFHS